MATTESFEVKLRKNIEEALKDKINELLEREIEKAKNNIAFSIKNYIAKIILTTANMYHCDIDKDEIRITIKNDFKEKNNE